MIFQLQSVARWSLGDEEGEEEGQELECSWEAIGEHLAILSVDDKWYLCFKNLFW